MHWEGWVDANGMVHEEGWKEEQAPMSSEGCDCPVCGEGYPAGRPECGDIEAHVVLVKRLREDMREAVHLLSESQLASMGVQPERRDDWKKRRDALVARSADSRN